MADAALVWVGAATLMSGAGVGSFVVRYATASEPHYWALAYAVVWAGMALELGQANGYLDGGDPFEVATGVCVVVAAVLSVVAVREQGVRWRFSGADAE